MTYYPQPRENLSFGDTVLTYLPAWAHKDDGSADKRMAVVIDDLGPVLMVALTSTKRLRHRLPGTNLRPRIEGDGCGQGNSLSHLSEVVLEPDGRLIIDKQDVIWTQAGRLKRGELAAMDKFIVACAANEAKPGVFAHA
jgi:hypothetical protein